MKKDAHPTALFAVGDLSPSINVYPNQTTIRLGRKFVPLEIANSNLGDFVRQLCSEIRLIPGIPNVLLGAISWC